MITAEIKLHPETTTYHSTTYTSTSTKVKPDKFTESKAPRVSGQGLMMPTEQEYADAVKEWASKGITAVGQKIFVKYHPSGQKNERVFTRILPREQSNVRYQGQTKKVEIIEIWGQEYDSFMRCAPVECSKD